MLIKAAPLEGPNLLLVPFHPDHTAGLRRIALHKEIWEHLPYRMDTEADFRAYIALLEERIRNGLQLCFTITSRHTGEVLGATGFLHPDPVNRKLELGGTWLAPWLYGSGINTEAKYLLLRACFTDHAVMRVELRTREGNIRSRKAIEKIGGMREGLLRMDRVNEDGSFRNTVLYSIIRPDWPQLQQRLERALRPIPAVQPEGVR